MKTALRNMGLRLAFGIIAALALMAYVRLAPSDPALWHVSPVTAAVVGQGTCHDAVRATKTGARAACLYRGDAMTLLSRLDQIAVATPNTIRLAGTPQSGRITWITRSAVMGFPDYTTAEATITATGTRLDIYARQRFGEGDWGVNAARLTTWLNAL